MSIFDFFFSKYSEYATVDIVLEAVGVLLGFLSVWLAKNNKIAVYPAGLIYTSIFGYLLLKWGLFGDMLINTYYFVMNVYGWYFWTQRKNGQIVHNVAKTTAAEYQWSLLLFFASLFFVFTIYSLFGRWNSWTAYTDTFTTAVFFVAMWLMARRKIECWILWIIGDVISVPLYFSKGLSLTSFQYLIFTLIAVFGYYSWKKILNKKKATV